MPYKEGVLLLHREAVYLFLYISLKNISSLSDDYRSFSFGLNYRSPPDLSTFAVALYVCTDDVKPTWLLDECE